MVQFLAWIVVQQDGFVVAIFATVAPPLLRPWLRRRLLPPKVLAYAWLLLLLCLVLTLVVSG